MERQKVWCAGVMYRHINRRACLQRYETISAVVLLNSTVEENTFHFISISAQIKAAATESNWTEVNAFIGC